jgi:Cu+-exporting ATPase
MAALAPGTKYTCPMHPQIVRDGPGARPLCGMALEPMTPQAGGAEDDSGLRDMTRRRWVSAALTLPVLLLAMGPMVGLPLPGWLAHGGGNWAELVLATPLVLWGGCWPTSRSRTWTLASIGRSMTSGR